MKPFWMSTITSLRIVSSQRNCRARSAAHPPSRRASSGGGKPAASVRSDRNRPGRTRFHDRSSSTPPPADTSPHSRPADRRTPPRRRRWTKSAARHTPSLREGAGRTLRQPTRSHKRSVNRTSRPGPPAQVAETTSMRGSPYVIHGWRIRRDLHPQPDVAFGLGTSGGTGR